MTEAQTAKTWVEHNPNTGSVRPFEVWFQVEGGAKKVIASCATREAAERNARKAAKRNTFGNRTCTYIA